MRNMMPATTTEHSTGMKATVLNRLPALLSLLSAMYASSIGTGISIAQVSTM